MTIDAPANSGPPKGRSKPADRPPAPAPPLIAPTGSPGLNAVVDVVNKTADPFMNAPPPEGGAAGVVSHTLGAALGVIGAPAEIIDTGFAAMTAPVAAMFPAMPAVTLLGMHVGVPHAHAHPPSLIPPAPPVPLPSIGALLGSGAVTVLIGGMPAARAGDIGISVTCGSLAPPFEVFTGSSNVFIGGARAARVLDITKHCNPTSMGPFAIAMGAAGVVAGAAGALASNDAFKAAQAAADAAVLAMKLLCGKDPGIPPGMGTLVGPPIPNVMIGGFPCPPIGDMALGGLLKGLKAAGKAIRARAARRSNGRCADGSHPIYLVTGENFDSFIDFVSGGLFEWRRHVTSARARTDSPLGYGWRHFYQRTLSVRLHRAKLTDWDGVELEFPRFARGSNVTEADGHVLRRIARGHYRVSHLSDPELEFVGDEFEGELRLTRVIGKGRELELSYDALGRLSAATEWEARTRQQRHYTFAYDNAGHLLQIAEGSGGAQPGWNAPQPVVRTAYTYSSAGELTRAWDALGGAASYEYDAFHRVIKQTDARGYSYTFKYDALGRCVEASGQDGLWWAKVEYFPEKRMTRYTEGDNATREYHYDSDGVITKIVDPYGGEELRELDGEGKVVREVDAGGRALEWLYDGNGAHVARVDRFGNVFPPELELPKLPNPFERQLPDTSLGWQLGSFLPPGYDAELGVDRSRLAGLPPDLVFQAETTFRLKPSDPNAQRVFEARVDRDDLGRPVREVDALGRVRHWQYDATGNVVAEYDRDGRAQTFYTTSWNLVGAKADPLGHATQYEYSRLEQIVGVTDPLGNKTRYEYDLKERLVRVHRNGRLREEYVFDGGDHLIEKRDGSGATLFENEIHENHLVAVRNLSSGGLQRYDYDALGRVTEASTDAHQVQLAYRGGPEALVDEHDGRGVEHTFDRGSWRTTVLGEFRLKRTPEGDTTRLVNSAGKRTVLRHEGEGLIRRRCSNGTVELLQYDVDGRLVARFAYKRDRRGRTTASSTRYSYTPEGDLLQVADSDRGTTIFEVDAAHRLIGEVAPDGTRHAYVQDPAGNVVSKPKMTGLRLREGNLVEYNSEEAFEHDGRDRVAVRRHQDGSVTRYVYDSFDQLVQVERASADGTSEPPWCATYDALGRRITACRGDAKREFFWDADRLAAEILPSGALRIYEYAARDALVPLGFTDYDDAKAEPASGRSYHVFTNQVGLPLYIEDDQGAVVWWADRVDPYGRIEVRPGAAVEYNLRWPGHYYDPETGLHYNRYRYYDPGLARYLQSDPIGFEGSPVNLYAYCPNPLVQVDLLGLEHGGRRGRSNRSGENDGQEGAPQRTQRAANAVEVSPVTGKKVKGAATVVEHSVDGQVVARYYVDSKGRTIRAEGMLDPPASYKKEGVSHIRPDGFESGRDHRGHLVPERSVPHQEAVNVRENVIAEHGRKSNLGPKKSWENRARKHAERDPGCWSVHEPQYDGDNPRPTSVKHSLYDSSGNEVTEFRENIANPDV